MSLFESRTLMSGKIRRERVLSITIIKKDKVFISAAVAALCMWMTIAAAMAAGPREGKMIDVEKTAERLRRHLTALTETIGDRSVQRPDNLERAAGYIEEVLSEMGLSVERQPFQYKGLTVANLISDIGPAGAPGKRYILGAHYDTVAGTPGADDNASAVAVMLETGRALVEMGARMPRSMAVRLAAFTLEEPPAFGTSKMGSKHYAKTARKTGERIDGMICPLQRQNPAPRPPERPRLFLGSGLRRRDGHRYLILPQSPLPPAFRHHGHAGLSLHGGTGGKSHPLFRIPGGRRLKVSP